VRDGATPVKGRLLAEESGSGLNRTAKAAIAFGVFILFSGVLLLFSGETSLDQLGGLTFIIVAVGFILLVLQRTPVRIYENGLEYGHAYKNRFIHWDNVDSVEDYGERGFALYFHDPYLKAYPYSNTDKGNFVTIEPAFPKYRYIKGYVESRLKMRPQVGTGEGRASWDVTVGPVSLRNAGELLRKR
jgi:hypothetical protein